MKSDEIRFRNDQQVTLIGRKRINTAWRFVSNGTWFDAGTDATLLTDCGWMGGLFLGTRTSHGLGELPPEGEKYKDEEVCDWTEFDIYDESGILLRKADPYNEKTAGIKFIK